MTMVDGRPTTAYPFGMAKGDLVKTTTYLYEDEMQALREVADRERCSQAEVIRRAVRAYVFDREHGDDDGK